MKHAKYFVIYSTVPSLDEAEKISGALIKTKLAACVNIIPGIKSVYWWKGKIESSKELLLIIKTKKAVVPKIIKFIKNLHSYKVPEIIALPIIEGNTAYLNWIKDSVKK